MLESLIVIIPTGIAFCFVASIMWKPEERLTLALIAATLVCFWIHCMALGFWWFEDNDMPQWLTRTSAVATCLVSPFAYLFVCSKVNKRLISISSSVLFLFILLKLVDNATISFDSHPIKDAAQPNQILFYSNGQAVFHIYVCEFILLLQNIWVMIRTICFAQELREKDMHLSKLAKKGIATLFILAVMMILSVTLPSGVWSTTVAKYTYMVSFALVITYGLAFLATQHTGNAILDSNEEPIYFGKQPRFEDMANKCHKLCIEDKIYCTPNLKIEDLARQLGTNRTYVAEMIKSHFNTTFAAYINELRVEEAKKLILENPDKKMEDIAMECGFTTAPTFTKAFKAFTGLTPSAWLAVTTGHESNESTGVPS